MVNILIWLDVHCCHLLVNFHLTKGKSAKENEEQKSEYRHDLNPEEYFDKYARKWINDDQASIVGGCCGIFPEHIEYISSKII